jgi:AraC family transcriptional regulator of adaptative response / DNA-3-methyladenine glycosylase II
MSISYQQARLTRDPRFDGRFFTAVKTTKIFCRSICPANAPLEKNVEYFQFAQQAMGSGYRPCLRCRPDSAPHSFAWQGVDTTVQRAMRLLKENKDKNIEDIAVKLGISSRYFRQLFKQKLGISPKQYQLFDKVLLAKQLLHQSHLPIEQVAQASGFASARRLQHNFKQVTGLTPQQIRQGKPTESQLISLKLAYRAPFNWQHMHAFLALRAIESVEDTSSNCYARTFILDEHKGWFRISPVPKQDCMKVEISLENIGLLSKVLSNIERVFDLNADIERIHGCLLATGIAKEDLTLGMRLPGVWDTFEAGCRAILGQQISVKAAINLLTQLTKELGERHQGKQYFPTAKAIANSPLEYLKIPQSRKQTLVLFAEYMLQNSDADIEQWLKIKGIGPWTVAYAKMRGQSDPDIWLDTDLIIKKHIKQHRVNAEQAKPWRSYLTFQLWSLA